VERLGSNRSIHLNIRFVAATKEDLGALSKQGTFREDLYFRLNVVPLSIPPLQPVGTEAALVLREGFGKMVLRGLGDPLLTLEHPVVVRHRQEVVAVLLVPVGDGLRKIVAIAPQGVGVQIAFPPAGLSGREFLKPTRTCDEGPKAKT
jgi:transcriptional regulator of acetoin/glycerol metabolism